LLSDSPDASDKPVADGECGPIFKCTCFAPKESKLYKILFLRRGGRSVIKKELGN